MSGSHLRKIQINQRLGIDSLNIWRDTQNKGDGENEGDYYHLMSSDSRRNTPYTGGLQSEKQIRLSIGTQQQRVLFSGAPPTPLIPVE